MILVDFHAVMIANIMVALYADDNADLEINEKLIRHKILNSLLKYQNMFREYGQMVISCDSYDYWRKELFPYYKISRKKELDNSGFDWAAIHKYMKKIKQEIKDNLNWPIIEVLRAESDDIIGTLARRLADEKVLIISRDKDFGQLHKYPWVKQFNPIADDSKPLSERFITIEDPEKFLFEHICKGDAGDSIPNVVSEQDSFAIGKRQRPMTQKKMDLWSESGVPEDVLSRFELNTKLIDLSKTPFDLQKEIWEEYEIQAGKSKKPSRHILNYLLDNGLIQLSQQLRDFI